MATKFFTNIHENPIISAVNNLNMIDEALKSPSKNVFLLTGNIMNLKDIINKFHEKGKGVFVHIDLIDGISQDRWSLEYIAKNMNPDGIITTKSSIARISKELGMFTIQRLFILDALSLKSGINLVKSTRPDAIEILPGIMPRIIKEIYHETRTPIITGGLIRYKEDVIESISAGAVGVSTSNKDIWYM